MAIAEGGGTVGRTVRCSRRGKGHAPLLYSTATDPGTRIPPSPGSWRCSLHRSWAPARNSNSGAWYVSVLLRPAGLPGVSVLSESEFAKYYQLQQVLRDADACAVVVITAWWTKVRRTSRDLKDLDKLVIDLETSLAVITLASPLVDSVVTFTQATMDALKQLDAAVDFILPLSPTCPSKAGSRNPPPQLSPLLIQLCMVSKMTSYGEQLGDDNTGVQGSWGRLVGMLASGVWFRVVQAPMEPFNQLDAVVDFILPLSPLLPSRLARATAWGRARATLPHSSLPFWSNFVWSLKWLLMVNHWEMTPWAYMVAELVLRECWRAELGFVSCVLLWSSLMMLMLLCCILLFLVDSMQVLWGLSRHLGNLTAANWVSFDLNVSWCSCRC